MSFKFTVPTLCFTFTWSILTQYANAVNSASIKAATEWHLRDMQSQIEDNYQQVVEANEHYAGCDVYDLCNDPPTLFTDDSEEIAGWSTSDTPWHNPQCNASEFLIGVKPNNHDPETGDPLTSLTCPQYNSGITCNYDNSNIGAGIKIPGDTDTDSQEFLDATCFAHKLEQISTTRIYSNCHTDQECYLYEYGDEYYSYDKNSSTTTKYTIDTIETTQIYCQDYGVCSNTDEPVIGSFAPDHVEYQYFGDQRTGILLNMPAIGWKTCPGTFDPRFRPWYVCI